MRKTATVLTLCVSVLAAACSGSGSDGKVTLQVWADAEEAAVYRTLTNAFMQKNPDIDIQLVPVADKGDHIQKLITAFAGGEPPDIFLVNFREFSQFVARGAIDPAGPLLEAAGLDQADYYEAPIEAFTYDGALQCWPQNISSLVVYFNSNIFAAAGIDPPAPDWTFDDFRATALAIKAATEAGDLPPETDALGIDSNIIRLAPFVWSNGGEIVDDVDDPSGFRLDEPAAREALSFIISLVRDDKVVPDEEAVAAQDLETRFAAGKLGMYLSSRRDTPVFREQIGLDWDVASLPTAAEPASILHSDAYCFASGAGDRDAAVPFVAFAVGDEGQTLTALGGRTVPSLRSVATTGAFLDPTRPPANSQVFLDAIPLLRRTPVIPTWPEIEDVAKEVFLRAFYDEGYTLDDALRDLAEQTGSLFEEGRSR